MSDLPADKKFPIVCQILRAQHFAWREAVRALHPDADATEAVVRMWEVTGAETARAYVPRIDRSLPIAPQVAASIAWSSQCMGEDAVAEPGAGSDEAFVRHRACPWNDWHRRLDLIAEDRPGCDAWLRATVDGINRALGTRLRFETIEALPEGGAACVRRLWVER